MKIPDPWRKSESEQMHQRENMLSETCGVGVMLCDFQITFVVKYVSRVAHTADDFAVKRAVLVQNMRINLQAWLLTVFQIDLTRVTTMTAHPKVLSIRRGGCPITPECRQRPFFLSIDQFGQRG